MKKLLNLTLALLILVSFKATAQSDVDKRCHKVERGGCPFILGGSHRDGDYRIPDMGSVVVLDQCTGSNPMDPRKTTIGETLCDAFNNVDKLADDVNKGTEKYRDKAEKEVREHLQPIFKGAIDEEALRDFNAAARFYEEILADMNAMLKDKDCGLNQMKNLEKFFNQQKNNLTEAGSILGSATNSITTEIPPAVKNISDFTAELTRAISIASQQGQKGSEDLKKIQAAFANLSKQVDLLKALDVAKVVASGTDLAVNVGGLYGSCTACAASIVSTLTNMAGTGAGTAALTACPESFELAGGACWGAPVAGLEAGATAISGVVSSGACALMTQQIANIESDIKSIQNFATTVQGIANNIKKSADIIDDASENLANLVKTTSQELKPSLEKMSKSLAELDGHITNVMNNFNNKIIPRVAKFSGNITKQAVANVEQLEDCYQKYVDFSERVTKETIAGIKEMFETGSKIVDAAKVMDNMGQGYANAVKAARDKATKEFNDVKTSYASLEKKLCIDRKGNGDLDLNNTADCLKNKILKNSPEDYLNEAKSILNTSNRLLADVGDLVQKSVKAADDAYLGKPKTTDRAKAVAMTTAMREKAKAAREKLKNSTAKEYAKDQAKMAAKQKLDAKKEENRKKMQAAKSAQVTDVDTSTTRRRIITGTKVGSN
jgi:hypothetical protein